MIKGDVPGSPVLRLTPNTRGTSSTLVRELRSHMPHGTANKEKRERVKGLVLSKQAICHTHQLPCCGFRTVPQHCQTAPQAGVKSEAHRQRTANTESSPALIITGMVSDNDMRHIHQLLVCRSVIEQNSIRFSFKISPEARQK